MRIQPPSSALSLILAGVLLAGCADDPVSEAEFLHGAGGVHTRVGEILLRDVSLDEPEDGTYDPRDIARLRVVLFNEGDRPDALLDVDTPAAASARLLVDADCDGTAEQLGEVPLPPSPDMAVAGSSGDGPEPYYRVDLLLDEQLRSGESIPVTFTFANAGSTTVQVPVELAGESRDIDDDPECEPAA